MESANTWTEPGDFDERPQPHASGQNKTITSLEKAIIGVEEDFKA